MKLNLKKVQPQLSNMFVFDIETFNTDRAVSCAKYLDCLEIVYKIPGKNDRDKTDQQREKCRKDCIVFKGTDNIIELLDPVLEFEEEARKVVNKIV